MTELCGAVPAGGIGLGPEEYADLVGKEYLGDYVRTGGAAVRFVVAGDDGVGARWHHSLASAADAEGYLYVAVDAEEHRVHLVDQIFAAVARQVDWMELARRQVRAGWESLGLRPAAPDELAVAYVAAHSDVDVPEAARSIRRYLETTMLRGPTLAREFRLAVVPGGAGHRGGPGRRARRGDRLAARGAGAPAAAAVGAAARPGRPAQRSFAAGVAGRLAARLTGTGIVLDVDLSRLAVTPGARVRVAVLTRTRPDVRKRVGHQRHANRTPPGSRPT
jgi:hypothetical protein